MTKIAMTKLARTAILLWSVLFAAAAFGTTYYVDYSGGSDSNNGTAKTTPWKHAPGMQGCTGNCATANPRAGDSIILKGGVTWPNASLGWLWQWNGSGSTTSIGCTGSGCIYVGVDQSWFSGTSWTRPILDGGGSQVSPQGQGSGNGVFIRCYCKNVHFDNLEMKGLVFTGSSDTYGQDVYFSFPVGTTAVGQQVEVSNFYIHGWSHTASNEHACGIIGDTSIPNNDTGSSIHDSVIDGSDTAKNSCSAIFGGVPYIYNNILTNVTSGAIVNGISSFHDNSVTHIVPSFDSGAHLNGLEINAAQNVDVYNNVIAHLGSGALALWCAPNQGFTCYIFNNVIYDTDTGNILDPAAPVQNGGCAHGSTYCNNAGSWMVWNNTVECGQDANPNATCIGINAAISSVVLENNHFITSQTSNGWWTTEGSNPTLVTNLVESKATANGQGYTSGELYAFSPTSASSPTVGNGTASTTMCLAASLGACQDSTTYGVAYNLVNHTVTTAIQALSLNLKPDIGAYQFSSLSSGTGGGQVLPPTQLNAVVN